MISRTAAVLLLIPVILLGGLLALLALPALVLQRRTTWSIGRRRRGIPAQVVHLQVPAAQPRLEVASRHVA